MIYSASPMTMNKSLHIKCLENLNSLNSNVKAATGALKGVPANQGQSSTENVAASTAHPQRTENGAVAYPRRTRLACFDGRYELVYKYTARGGNRHGMQSIRNILLKRALRLILQENSFQFNGKNCLQTHFSRMRTSQNLDIFCEIIYFNLFLSLSLHFFFFISSFVARFIVFFAWNCGWLTF